LYSEPACCTLQAMTRDHDQKLATVADALTEFVINGTTDLSSDRADVLEAKLKVGDFVRVRQDCPVEHVRGVPGVVIEITAPYGEREEYREVVVEDAVHGVITWGPEDLEVRELGADDSH
jgi:hypothetical protein